MNDSEGLFASNYTMPADSPGFQLWSQFLTWQRGLNAVLLPLGLTQPQFAILAMCGWLCRDDGATNQRDIAVATGMDKMHVSQVIARLVRATLVGRTAGGEDARIRPITPTITGWRLLSEALPIVEAFDANYFAKLAK